MFDLTASVDLAITGFDYMCLFSSATTIEVYYVTDHTSYVDKEGDSSSWTLLVSTATFVTYANPTRNHLDVPSGLIIRAGETVGIYFTTTDSLLLYSNGPLGSFSTTELVLEDRGAGVDYPFTGNYYPRVWNGVVYYQYNLPTPSPSPSPSTSPSASRSPTTSPTASTTPSVSPSPSASPTASPSPSVARSFSDATRLHSWLSFFAAD
jgi:hypothetical protein